jgi:hypothetical protein
VRGGSSPHASPRGKRGLVPRPGMFARRGAVSAACDRQAAGDPRSEAAWVSGHAPSVRAARTAHGRDVEALAEDPDGAVGAHRPALRGCSVAAVELYGGAVRAAVGGVDAHIVHDDGAAPRVQGVRGPGECVQERVEAFVEVPVTEFDEPVGVEGDQTALGELQLGALEGQPPRPSGGPAGRWMKRAVPSGVTTAGTGCPARAREQRRVTGS